MVQLENDSNYVYICLHIVPTNLKVYQICNEEINGLMTEDTRTSFLITVDVNFDHTSNSP